MAFGVDTPTIDKVRSILIPPVQIVQVAPTQVTVAPIQSVPIQVIQTPPIQVTQTEPVMGAVPVENVSVQPQVVVQSISMKPLYVSQYTIDKQSDGMYLRVAANKELDFAATTLPQGITLETPYIFDGKYEPEAEDTDRRDKNNPIKYNGFYVYKAKINTDSQHIEITLKDKDGQTFTRTTF